MIKKYLSFLVAVAAAASLYARPHVAYIYPTGVQRGARVRVLIGGQRLSGIIGAMVNAKGITVRKITQVPGFPHPENSQRRYLMDYLKRISQGNPTSPAKIKEIQNWRKNKWWDTLDQLPQLELELVRRNLYIRRNSLQDNPSMRQMVIVDIEASHEAELGEFEFVLWNRRGVSAPKIFFVDDAPHQAEGGFIIPSFPLPQPPSINTLPAILNGQIMPGECDRFNLRMIKGTWYTLTLTGRKFQPFIGDAVPGHFQPVMRILNSAGRELAFADDEYFNPDPVLRFKAPYTSVFTLEVRDFLYRGREDFIYRIDIAKDNIPYRFAGKSFTGFPELNETEIKTPLAASATVVINGTISNPGEKDRFPITGRKDEVLAVKVAARCDGSPLDAELKLLDHTGRVIAGSDDTPTQFNVGPIIQQIDPELNVKLPADGTYSLVISDLTGKAGSDYRYRIRCGQPQMDFNVYTATSAAMCPPQRNVQIKLHVERTANFDQPIRITGANVVQAKNNQPQIAAKATGGSVIIRNPAKGNAPPVPVELFAEAVINGKTVRKRVIPTDTFNQAFAYDHLLPVQNFYLGTTYVRPRPPRRPPRRPRRQPPKAAPKAAPRAAK